MAVSIKSCSVACIKRSRLFFYQDNKRKRESHINICDWYFWDTDGRVKDNLARWCLIVTMATSAFKSMGKTSGKGLKTTTYRENWERNSSFNDWVCIVVLDLSTVTDLHVEGIYSRVAGQWCKNHTHLSTEMWGESERGHNIYNKRANACLVCTNAKPKTPTIMGFSSSYADAIVLVYYKTSLSCEEIYLSWCEWRLPGSCCSHS